MKKVLITGSEGFIGSNMVKYWLSHYPDDQIIRVDAFTYAARTPMITEGQESYTELHSLDIRNQEKIESLIASYKPDLILHYAAESHVCKSIKDPTGITSTNIGGTLNLLESVRKHSPNTRFIHISTDEVFGQLKRGDMPFTEMSQIKPRSPYSASKAASDHLCFAYAETYGLDIVVTNSSNVFGPNQHEEKLIARTIMSVLQDKPMVLYGNGSHIRDWIYVNDHCSAIDLIAKKGKTGERYCIGGLMEYTNKEMVETIHALFYMIYPAFDAPLNIEYSNDRPTDDFRYAVNPRKLMDLGWRPSCEQFALNLMNTIQFYVGENAKKTKAVHSTRSAGAVSQFKSPL